MDKQKKLRITFAHFGFTWGQKQALDLERSKMKNQR